MPFGDKMMMKVFAKMMKHKKDKNEYEKKFEKAIAASYDFSSRGICETVGWLCKGRKIVDRKAPLLP